MSAGPCGRSPAEIVGSNPTGGMDICLLWVLCVVRLKSLRRADHSSRGVLPTVLRRCVWSKNPQEWGDHDPRWVAASQNKKHVCMYLCIYYVFLYVCIMYVSMHVCQYACMSVCMYAYTCYECNNFVFIFVTVSIACRFYTKTQSKCKYVFRKQNSGNPCLENNNYARNIIE